MGIGKLFNNRFVVMILCSLVKSNISQPQLLSAEYEQLVDFESKKSKHNLKTSSGLLKIYQSRFSTSIVVDPKSDPTVNDAVQELATSGKTELQWISDRITVSRMFCVCTISGWN